MTRPTHRIVARVLTAAILLTAGCASAPPPPDPSRGIDEYLAYVREEGEKAARSLRQGGIGVVVVADGEVVMAEGFGYSDSDERTPIEAETVMRIGSITKLFTGLALMQLVESGLVELDAPMTDYIPELSLRTRGPYPPFTVRDVMIHEAGLPGDYLNGWASDQTDAPGWEARYREYPELLADVYATYPPRTVFSYSNIGYSLLGVLIERVAGVSYADYVEQHILDPLGMDSSSLYLEEESADRVATGYLPRRSPYGDLTQIRDIPAGSLYASLADMGRFMEMLVAEGSTSDGAHVVTESTFAEMSRVQNSDTELDFGFSVGLTFWLVDLGLPDTHLLNHMGNIPPYNGCLFADPTEDLAVFTVTNSQAGADLVLELGVELTRALVASHRGRPLPLTSPYDLPEVPLSDETVNALTGTWIGPMGVMDVSGRRGRLIARLGGIPITAVHRGDGLLSLDVRVLGIPLVRVSYATLILHEVDGEHYMETIYHGLSIGSAIRYDPPPVSPVWRNRAGEYEVLNPGGGSLATGVELQYDNRRDRLTAVILDHSGHHFMILPLEIIDDTMAITGGLGRTSDEVFETRMIDGEEHLFISGLELRQLE